MSYDQRNRVTCPECSGSFWPSTIDAHKAKYHPPFTPLPMASNESWPGAIPKAIQAIEDNERARTPLYTQSQLDEAVQNERMKYEWLCREFTQDRIGPPTPSQSHWVFCESRTATPRFYDSIDTLVAAEMAREKAPVTGERQS